MSTTSWQIELFCPGHSIGSSIGWQMAKKIVQLWTVAPRGWRHWLLSWTVILQRGALLSTGKKHYTQLETTVSSSQTTIFLQSDAAATIFLAVCFMRLLFEGGVYFVGKPADSNNDWNRYMRAIQIAMIDAGSSTCSLSVLLLAVETSLRTWTALEIAQ